MRLVLESVSKSFASTVALESFDLTLEPGRTTVLIGPSGCGKSTLLRLIVGLIRPDKGRIMFGDQALAENSLLDLRRKVGYVIQEGGLFPHLTAAKNVTLMAEFLGREAKDIEARLAELADLTDLPRALLDRYPMQLSGGQRQRVSIMRALMLDPEVLLFDEPLGALDPMIRADLQRDLQAIFKELGKTVLIVTHDLGEAGFFGDVIVLLQDGRIVQQGTLAELVKAPASPFVERFVNAQRSPLESLGKD